MSWLCSELERLNASAGSFVPGSGSSAAGPSEGAAFTQGDGAAEGEAGTQDSVLEFGTIRATSMPLGFTLPEALEGTPAGNGTDGAASVCLDCPAPNPNMSSALFSAGWQGITDPLVQSSLRPPPPTRALVPHGIVLASRTVSWTEDSHSRPAYDEVAGLTQPAAPRLWLDLAHGSTV